MSAGKPGREGEQLLLLPPEAIDQLVPIETDETQDPPLSVASPGGRLPMAIMPRVASDDAVQLSLLPAEEPGPALPDDADRGLAGEAADDHG